MGQLGLKRRVFDYIDDGNAGGEQIHTNGWVGRKQMAWLMGWEENAETIMRHVTTMTGSWGKKQPMWCEMIERD